MYGILRIGGLCQLRRGWEGSIRHRGEITIRITRMNSIKTSNFNLNKEWLNESNFHVGLFLDIKWKEIHQWGMCYIKVSV